MFLQRPIGFSVIFGLLLPSAHLPGYSFHLRVSISACKWKSFGPEWSIRARMGYFTRIPEYTNTPNRVFCPSGLLSKAMACSDGKIHVKATRVYVCPRCKWVEPDSCVCVHVANGSSLILVCPRCKWVEPDSCLSTLQMGRARIR